MNNTTNYQSINLNTKDLKNTLKILETDKPEWRSTSFQIAFTINRNILKLATENITITLSIFSNIENLNFLVDFREFKKVVGFVKDTEINLSFKSLDFTKGTVYYLKVQDRMNVEAWENVLSDELIIKNQTIGSADKDVVTERIATIINLDRFKDLIKKTINHIDPEERRETLQCLCYNFKEDHTVVSDGTVLSVIENNNEIPKDITFWKKDSLLIHYSSLQTLQRCNNNIVEVFRQYKKATTAEGKETHINHVLKFNTGNIIFTGKDCNELEFPNFSSILDGFDDNKKITIDRKMILNELSIYNKNFNKKSYAPEFLTCMVINKNNIQLVNQFKKFKIEIPVDAKNYVEEYNTWKKRNHEPKKPMYFLNPFTLESVLKSFEDEYLQMKIDFLDCNEEMLYVPICFIDENKTHKTLFMPMNPLGYNTNPEDVRKKCDEILEEIETIY